MLLGEVVRPLPDPDRVWRPGGPPEALSVGPLVGTADSILSCGFKDAPLLYRQTMIWLKLHGECSGSCCSKSQSVNGKTKNFYSFN